MKKIILTGGGTAGHVTPNLALLPSLKKAGYEIRYIGSYQGIERKLIEGAGIPYDGISSGKLRRYFDLKNFSDPFRVAKGYFEALRLMKRYKPDEIYKAAQYDGLEIMDRVGGGDSFASGLVYGLMTFEDAEKAVNYGAAHGALAMTTPGDTTMASLKEVEGIVGGAGARVQR